MRIMFTFPVRNPRFGDCFGPEVPAGTGAGPKDVASKNVALRSAGGRGHEEVLKATQTVGLL